MHEHVVELAGRPRPLGQRCRLLAGPLGLGLLVEELDGVPAGVPVHRGDRRGEEQDPAPRVTESTAAVGVRDPRASAAATASSTGAAISAARRGSRSARPASAM